MIPRLHAIYGALFALMVWAIGRISWQYALVIFLATVFIDFDHYLAASVKTKIWTPSNALKYYELEKIKALKERSMGIRRRGTFHFLHTIEVHIIIALIGIFWMPAFYVFVGIMFHTLLDIWHLVSKDAMYRREFLFWNWIRKKF